MRRLAVTALVLALAFPAAAAARTITLNWSERAPDTGPLVMTFRVGKLVAREKAWGATVSFTNRTKVRLRIVPRFGLGVYKTRKQQPTRVLPAVVFNPALPRMLGPGQTWTGAFAGATGIPDGVYIRAIFGVFIGKVPPPLGPRMAWVTDHVFLYSTVTAL